MPEPLTAMERVQHALVDASNFLQDVDADDRPYLAARLLALDQAIDAALGIANELTEPHEPEPDWDAIADERRDDRWVD